MAEEVPLLREVRGLYEATLLSKPIWEKNHCPFTGDTPEQ